MPRPDFPMTVLEFQSRFSTEEACLEYLRDSRWPDGFVCPKCEWTGEPYWKAARKLLQCKSCGYQASVTAGTVLHRTKQPLRVWFHAAYLVSTHTPGFSALQFQRQVGIKNYETAFQMLHKLRAAMVREGREKLSGLLEVDETYIGGAKTGPGGRGALGKVIVAAAVEIVPRVNKAGRSYEAAGRARLRVVPNITGETLVAFVQASVEAGSTIRTDGLTSYNGLTKAGYNHEVYVEDTPESAHELFPHIHRVFSNLKSWLIGTHHGVSPQHLQAYLNEYVFRFNRRGTPMAAFQTVLGLTDERLGPTYDGLYGVAKKEEGAWVHPNPMYEEGA